MKLKKYFSKFIQKRKTVLSEKDLILQKRISEITGQKISNLHFYRKAFSLKVSSPKRTENYERLEFLGDSILGSIMACYLFKNYSTANEGYLTQMKAKIVNRKNLNKLGEDLKLTNLIQNESSSALGENISGNLLEALIGALYLDLGYDTCQKIILEKLFTKEEILKLENKIASYKSLLLEWSQKRKVQLQYRTSEEEHANKVLVFRSCVWLGKDKIASATESSKKKAEEKAAQRAFYTLNKKEHIFEKSNRTA